MPIATQDETRGTAISVGAATASNLDGASPEGSAHARTTLERSEPVARLAALLEEDPVDLAQISDEIRLQPELADAMRRFAAYLQLAPEETVSSVEEAAVVLGTERLRVLLHGWPAFQNAFRHARGTNEAQRDADGHAEAARSVESEYLASLRRLLVLENPATTAASSETAEMSEMLLRDFIALLPRINLPSLAAERKRGPR